MAAGTFRTTLAFSGNELFGHKSTRLRYFVIIISGFLPVSTLLADCKPLLARGTLYLVQSRSLLYIAGTRCIDYAGHMCYYDRGSHYNTAKPFLISGLLEPFRARQKPLSIRISSNPPKTGVPLVRDFNSGSTRYPRDAVVFCSVFRWPWDGLVGVHTVVVPLKRSLIGGG